jgi:V-type H+-transporting ATPase subunit C
MSLLCCCLFGNPNMWYLTLMDTQTNAKQAKKAKSNLDASYSYLGGNAFGRDSKGRIKKDDAAMSTDMQSAGHSGDQDYSAYVFYEFEIV